MRFALFVIAISSALTACHKPSVDPVKPDDTPASLEVTLRSDGVAFAGPHGPIGPGCVAGTGVTLGRSDGGPFDAPEVTRCARKLKTSEPRLRKSSSVVINAQSDTPYQDVLSVMYALSADTYGDDLFPSATFGFPTPPPRSTRTAAPIVDAGGASFKIPAANAVEDDSPDIVVSKLQIIVGDDRILSFADADAVATRGLPAAVKRNGQDDYLVVPLRDRLVKQHDMMQSVRASKGIDPSLTYDVILIAEPTTPYRVVREVLFTASESGFDKYHLMVLQKAR